MSIFGWFSGSKKEEAVDPSAPKELPCRKCGANIRYDVSKKNNGLCWYCYRGIVRVDCKECGAKITPGQFEQNDGLCKSCKDSRRYDSAPKSEPASGPASWKTVAHGDYGWLRGTGKDIMGLWMKSDPNGSTIERFEELLVFVDSREANGAIKIEDEAKTRLRSGAVSVIPVSDELGGGHLVLFSMGMDIPRIGIELNGETSSADTAPKVRASVQLPPALDGQGDLNIRDIVKSYSPDQLREMLWALPVEAITLDQVLEGDTERHDRLFELCLQFSSVLANYDKLREEHPEFNLPEGVPSEELAALIVPRFVEQIQKQNGPDILPAAAHRIYSLSMDLITAGRFQEAHECLLVCREARTAADPDEISFWIWACLHNVATASKSQQDLRRALDAADKIPAHRREEVAGALEWARNHLEN